MASNLFLVLAVLTYAAAVSAQSVRCTAPSKWEGKANVYRFNIARLDQMYIHYDADSEMVAEIDIIDAKTPGRKFYERIYHYKEKVVYTIMQSTTRSCTKSFIPPNQAFRAFGPPVNSTYAGSISLGGGTESFTANMYELRAENHPTRLGTYLGTWTALGCIPVYEVSTYGNGTNIVESTHTQFDDVTIGIANPNVFNPPSNCP